MDPPPPAPAANPETVKSHSDPPPAQSPSSDPSPPTSKSVSWSRDLTQESPAHASAADLEDAEHYVSAPTPTGSAASSQNTIETVKDALGRWRRKVGETTRKGQDLAGNMWQHLRTGPSLADAAMGRIAQGTKVIAEGGYEKIFQQTFDTLPEEKLQKSYVCYLSTSAGPVMGMLYLSTSKLAFCSDNPLSYKVGDQTEWSYYKVVIPLHQLRAVNPSKNKSNTAEKYIQIVSVDNHEFWFMGFVSYDNAVMSLQEALRGASNFQP